MVKKINSMQAALILAISTINLKFLIFPSIFARYAQKDSYISLALGLAFDLVAIIIVLMIIKHNPNITFGQLISRSLGVVVSKIIYVVIFIMLFFKAILTIKEVHNYFNNVLFDNLDWFVYIFPLFIFIAYLTMKDFRTFGRTLQFFLPFIVIALLSTIIIPSTVTDFSNLLPILENGGENIFYGFFKCSFVYDDYLILLLMMGKINYTKNTNKTIITTLVFTDIIIIAFYILFVAVFQNTGVNQAMGVSEVLLHTDITTVTGTLDWINILIWLIIMFIQMGVAFYCCALCLNEIFKFKTKYTPMIIVVASAIVFVCYLYLNLMKMIDIITSLPMTIINVVVQFLIPILCIIASIILVSKKERIGLIDVYNTKIIKYQLTDIEGAVCKKKFYIRER